MGLYLSLGIEAVINKMANGKYFLQSWLSDSRFAEWVAQTCSKENGLCKLCKCDISLSNMGEKSLGSHAKGKKHTKKLGNREQIRNFLKVRHSKDTTEESTDTSELVNLAIPLTPLSTAGSTPATSASSRTLDNYVQDSARQKAEIIWAIKHVYSRFGDNSTQDVVDLFRAMFPDSKIAERMQLGPNKLKYVVEHGIAPSVKDLLKSQVISTVVCCLLTSL